MKEFFNREKEMELFAEIERLSALSIEHMKRGSYEAGWRCTLEAKKLFIVLIENDKKRKAHYKQLRKEVRSKDYSNVYREYMDKLKALE